VSLPRKAKEVKLVMSLLYGDEMAFASAAAAADARYGSMDFMSEPLSFEYTRYYEREMGKGLKRRVAGFRRLIPPDDLPAIKVWTNELEGKYLNLHGGRAVNIDPGYLHPAKFVLATGKDYSHRIYLGNGIYGDLTLMVQKGAFIRLPWTYPDYASAPLIDLLTLLRKRYLWQIKNAGAGR
jgi:hypothetical protein